MHDLLADFLTETHESLAELDAALIRLQRAPDDTDTLALVFRLVHTIKGTCGFLGLARLERVAHAGEHVLGRLRDGAPMITPRTITPRTITPGTITPRTITPGAITPGAITLVLAGLDRIRAILAGLSATGAEPDGDDTALIAALNRVADRDVADRDVADRDVADREVADREVAPLSPLPSTAEEPDPAGQAMTAPQTTVPQTTVPQTIRVPVGVLDDLMAMVSALALTRDQLIRLARTPPPGGQDGNASRARDPRADAFAAPLRRLSDITSDLQAAVMKTRMQPIGQVWNRLPRLVRDLGHDLGKPIDLVLRGADTALDRQALELIRDPLTHMVRNSADHGLEAPAARRAAGKPQTGRITLDARHRGDHVRIEVADDGGGLPVERIRARALAQGLATPAELAAMTDVEIQRFIFRAGFSTAAAVTAVSGRGVGMDVVQTHIARIGGSIDVASTPGQGTVFTLRVPLTGRSFRR